MEGPAAIAGPFLFVVRIRPQNVLPAGFSFRADSTVRKSIS
jgi:hypothetical protein